MLKKIFSHFPVEPVWLLTLFYSQKNNYMLSCVNINTFLMQVICCPMSLFAFTVYHSRFQLPKNCFLSSKLDLGQAFSSLAVVQNPLPKELLKKRVVLWLCLRNILQYSTNLTYPLSVLLCIAYALCW